MAKDRERDRDRHPVSPIHLLPPGRIKDAAVKLLESRRRREEDAGIFDESERKDRQMPRR